MLKKDQQSQICSELLETVPSVNKLSSNYFLENILNKTTGANLTIIYAFCTCYRNYTSMARSSPYSCGYDIEIMIRTGVWDWRHRTSKRYRWPREAILVVQSNRLNEIYHSKPKHINGRAQHAECAFLDEIESADQSLSLEDYFSKMRMRQQKTEYDLYINYSPCVDCADRIIEFINNHKVKVSRGDYLVNHE